MRISGWSSDVCSSDLILQLAAALAPLVGTVLTALGQAIQRIAGLFMENLFPAISGLIPILLPILDVFLTVFGAQVVNAIDLIVDVLGGVFDILGGLITFLTGVFTGDWDKARSEEHTSALQSLMRNTY